MINQKRPFITQHRKTVSYGKHSSQQKSIENNDKKQLTNTRRLHSNPSKQFQPSLAIEQAKTTRISTINTSHSINRFHNPTPPKLITLPILPSPDTIKTLDYSNQKIFTVPKNFATYYGCLIRLNLSHNDLAQILPICYLESLEELNLSSNLINHIPKEIKKLIKLTHIDLGFNKLWYLSQVISLKELVILRVDQMNQSIQINLEGNSVLKTNQKAVMKLLSSTKLNHQSRSQIRSVVRQTLEQNKENIHPNMIEFPKQISSQKANKQFQKMNKSSNSLNRSLLDVSAIMGPLPVTLIDQKINQFQTVPQTLFLKQQFSHNQPEKSINPQEQTPLLSDHKELAQKNISYEGNELFSQSLQKIQSPINKKQNCFSELFKKVHNFESDFVEPFKSHLKELLLVEKKVKLIPSIKEIPEFVKPEFLKVNEALLNKIAITKDFLAAFENFYSQDIPSICSNIQHKLNQVILLDNQVKSFHEKILSAYLNSSESTELKWYQVWLHQLNNFNQLFQNIQDLSNHFTVIFKKVQQISQVTLSLNSHQNYVASNKNDYQQKQFLRQDFSQKKTSSKNELKNLLFSDNKYKKTSLFSSSKKQSLLLTQKQTQSVRNQQFQDCPKPKQSLKCQNCLECPIKDQQIIQLTHSLNDQKQKNVSLNNEIDLLKQTIQDLVKSQDFYKQIQLKQSELIDQVSQIKPSTYQNVLLTQAKCIEDLILGNQQGILHKQDFLKNTTEFEQKDQEYVQSPLNNNFQKHSLGKKIMTKQNKIELNQFLLTEQSMNSNKKITPQILERTYFKSNGTLPFSQSKTVGNHISKESRQTKNSKTLSKINQLSKFDEKVFPFDQYSNNPKHQVFQDIELDEYDQKRLQKKQRQKLNVDKTYNNQKSYFDQKVKIQKDQTHKLNNQNIQHNRNRQNQKYILSISNNFCKNGSSSPSQCKKRSKTQFNLHSHAFKDFIPSGYDYKQIQLKQNIQYQNYLKYHLRNNIKQILQKKQSFNNSKSVLNMRNFILTDFFPKAFPNSNFCNDLRSSHQNDKDPNGKLVRSASDMKKNSSGKYIKKQRYTYGK